MVKHDDTALSGSCGVGSRRRGVGDHVPALNGLSTFGDTREEALANTREAIEGYFEAAAKEGIVIPDHQMELLDLEVAVA